MVSPILRPFARAWVTSSTKSWRNLSFPTDNLVAYATGANADRVLLMGSGIAVGYGVSNHTMGLPGALARGLSALTGRGTTVDVRAAPDMRASDGAAMLPALELSRFDAIVAVFGGLEAVTFGSVSSWRTGLESFLARVESLAPTLPVFVVSVPFASSMVDMPWIYRRLTDSHTRQINRASERVCAERRRATYVSFEPLLSRVVEDIGRRHYERWAALIVPPIAQGLNEHGGSHTIVTDEVERLAALQRLEIHEGDLNSELQVLIEVGRAIFGASGAELNILERTRQWTLVTSGTNGRAIPREQSICATTIASPDALIIEDTRRTDAYRNLALAPGDDPVRFYAGYPIEAPDGHRIGALCIIDHRPRTFGANDQRLLRELALRAQALLWEKYAGVAR